MSELKVGDRVRFITAVPADLQIIATKVGEIAEVVEAKEYGEFPIRIRFSDRTSEWMALHQLRRLVKRKRPKPSAPDRVSLRDHFAGLAMQALLSPNHPWGGNADEAIPRIAYKVADAMIAEGAK